MNEMRNRVKSIFLDAVENHPPERWPAFLDSACRDEPDLLVQVQALLNADRAADSLLDALEPKALEPKTPESDVRTVRLSEPFLPATSIDGPGTTIGAYTLLKPIGEGGMGVVYRAEQAHPVRRTVALKIIKPGMDTRQVITRFEAERQALAMMDHPGIAKVFDAGSTEQGRPFFVMELVEGVPITTYCDSVRLTPRQRLELLIPICRAIQHAHQKGIIHRDIKPSNVMVAMVDGTPVPKVIDFGVAKAVDRRLTAQTIETHHGAVVGTFEYMSPEQAAPGLMDIDTRSDIYGLGVLIYELLTGTTPLEKETVRQAPLSTILRAIREEESPKPSARLGHSRNRLTSLAARRGTDPARLVRQIRGELDWIVMKCLEKDRARRYESAAMLATDLARYLSNEPVEAGPPSSWYRICKFIRRYRVALMATGLVLSALITGVVVSTWQALRALQAEREQAVALAEAGHQRNEAARKEAEARAVLEFLVNKMISSTGPYQRERGSSTVEDVLARADEEIEDHFADQPLMEASIRHAIGLAYFRLLRDDKAEIHLRRAVALRAEQLGASHPETLESKLQLGELLLKCDWPRTLHGQRDARAIFEEVADARRRALGPTHPDTLAVESMAAYSLVWTDETQEARAILERVHEEQRRLLGLNHPRTLITRQGLACALLRLGNTERAEALFRSATGAQIRWNGSENPWSLWAIQEFAYHMLSRGRLAESRRLFERLIEANDRAYGPDHSHWSGALSGLIDVLRQQRRPQDTQTLFERRISMLDQPVNESPYLRDQRAMSLNGLAWVFLVRAGEHGIDPQALVRLAEEAAELAPATRSFWNTLGVAHYRAGQWDQAIVALNRAMELRSGNGYDWFPMAAAHAARGDHIEALSWYDRALAWMKREPGRLRDDELKLFRAEAEHRLGLDTAP